MGHCPKKVFIKENGGYIALSYEAFCERRLYQKDHERFFLPIQGCLLETDQETYRSFYQEQERTRYLEQLKRKAGVLSLDEIDLDREAVHSPFHAPDEALEELAWSHQRIDQLRQAISRLTPTEKKLLLELYDENRSERNLAKQYGISHNAIHKRKKRILKKLKNFLNW